MVVKYKVGDILKFHHKDKYWSTGEWKITKVYFDTNTPRYTIQHVTNPEQETSFGEVTLSIILRARIFNNKKERIIPWL